MPTRWVLSATAPAPMKISAKVPMNSASSAVDSLVLIDLSPRADGSTGIDPSKVDGGRDGGPAARRKDGRFAALSLVLVTARPLLLHAADDGGDHAARDDARGLGEEAVPPAGDDDPPAGEEAA